MQLKKIRKLENRLERNLTVKNKDISVNEDWVGYDIDKEQSKDAGEKRIVQMNNNTDRRIWKIN